MQSTLRPGVDPLFHTALSTSSIPSTECERERLMHYHLDHHKVAMDELIRSHMPIISRVAGSGTRNSGVNINVVVQTATEGLLIAINRRSSDAGGARPPDC